MAKRRKRRKRSRDGTQASDVERIWREEARVLSPAEEMALFEDMDPYGSDQYSGSRFDD